MQTIAYASPIGILYLSAEDGALTCVTGHEPEDLSSLVSLAEAEPLLQKAEGQLREYFAGRRKTFDLPLRPEGTAFRKKVWQALTEIPYGTTRTYGQIAEAVGSPKAARAVGSACHNNPLLLLVPCHRVVGAGGSLTGFGLGIPVKEALLELEGNR